MTLRPRSLAIAAVAALTLTACGGSDSTDGPTATGDGSTVDGDVVKLSPQPG